MIGVALVVLVAIFAAGLRATIDQGIDEQVKAVSIVTHDDGFSPLPSGDRRGRSSRSTASPRSRGCASRPAAWSARPATRPSPASTPTRPRDVITLKWADGSDAVLSGLGTTGVAVPKEFADKHDLKIGSPLRLTAPRGNEVDLPRASGIYEPGAGVIGGVLASNASLEADWDAKDVAFFLVAGDDPETRHEGRGGRAEPASRPPSRRRSRASRTSRTSRSTRSSGSSTRCSRCR